ncbi:MAG: serine hydrolase, partial [Acidobacteriota bacterium]
ERIFKPLGMENSGYDHHGTVLRGRATGYERNFDGYRNSPYLDMSLPYAAGSLYSTVGDLYVWDQALYTEKLLSKELKDLYFKPQVPAMGGSYAYGWVIQKVKLPGSEAELNLIAHGGGINGFNTLIQRLVDDRHLVVLLNNAPGADLGAMARGITHILYDKPFDLPRQSIAEAIYPTLIEKGVEAAIMQYRRLEREDSKGYVFQPRELNRLAYFLLRDKKQIDDAIAIFKFNVEANPQYADGFEGLADAYMEIGDQDEAVRNYARSLEINPKNTGAVNKLNELVKRK